MKVAQYINSTDTGGAEGLVLTISKELTERGIDNIIYHHGNQYIVDRANVHTIELTPRPVREIINNGKAMANIMKNNNVSVLHSHLYGATLRGTFGAKYAKIPHIATQHDTLTITEKPSRIVWLRGCAMLGTTLVMISDEMKQTYAGFNKQKFMPSFSKDKTITIYNGVDTKKYFPRHNSGLSDTFNIISVGRLEHVKNYALLITAMNFLVNVHKIKNLHLTLVGEGYERAMLEKYANQVIPGVVSFLGLRDDVPELLSKADLFVLPSYTEGLSCSILEAMASGLPILASNVGGNPELVDINETSGNGVLFESNNVDMLVQSILKMYHATNLKSKGNKSRDIINTKFSIDTMMNQYVNLYFKLTQRGV